MRSAVGCICILLFFVTTCVAQFDSARTERVVNFPSHFFSKVSERSRSLNTSLSKQTERYLLRLETQEKKMRKQLAKSNPQAASDIFDHDSACYQRYLRLMVKDSVVGVQSLNGEYLPGIDSLRGVLGFAGKSSSIMLGGSQVQQQAQTAFQNYNRLQFNLNNTDQIKEYIRQRKQMLKNRLIQHANGSNLRKYLDQYNRQSYYYAQQIRDYKQALNNPDKLLKKALAIMNKFPTFKKFMQQNGQLAALFGLSPDYGSPEGLEGLQTRSAVEQALNGRIGSGGAGIFAANLASAHDQLEQGKSKLNMLGAGSGDIDMPDFKPNQQKTKPFFSRLEFGFDIQTVKANGYFPAVSDFGISVGYKLFGGNITGFGASYKVGWGSDINHIRFSSQGVGLRSFLDVKLKNNLFLSGGFEENYVTPFTSISQLHKTSFWEQSGLIGVGKIISLPQKIVKKTKASILWDFLSYTQIPRTQAFKFRLGYNF